MEEMMLSLRQIHSTKNNCVTIQLPDTFSEYRRVEVIILPIEDSRQTKVLSTSDFIEYFAGAIPDFPDVEKSEIQEYEEYL
jgi:hypothetical protein